MVPLRQRLCKYERFFFIRYSLSLGALTLFFQLQGQPRLSGSVQEPSGKGIPFANVLLLDAKDSSLVKGMVTDQDGRYRLEQAKAGHYRLMVSRIGYRPAFSLLFTISQKEGNVFMPPLVLAAVSNQLQAVRVVVQKPLHEQHLDRLVINVQSSMTSAGSNALEVLERSPGVTVNRQMSSLSLNGKEGVLMLVVGP